MDRLIAFGCSVTYGIALLDCKKDHFNQNPPPSKYAYPQVMANILNLECHNLAVPGASNVKILDMILNFQFEPNDLIIVQWTFSERDLKIGRAHV